MSFENYLIHSLRHVLQLLFLFQLQSKTFFYFEEFAVSKSFILFLNLCIRSVLLEFMNKSLYLV